MDLKLFENLLPKGDEYVMDLQTASSLGCEERTLYIIENSEDTSSINKANSSGWTALMYAVFNSNLKIVGILLAEGALTNVKNNLGQTALILASKCGSIDAVNKLIECGASINDRDQKGWSALLHAAASGHRSVVQLLVKKGAIADHVDKQDGLTPLMISSAAGHEMIVKDLLQLGLNPNSRSKSGETARSLAVKNGHVKVTNLIDAHERSRKYCHFSKLTAPDFPGQSDLLKLLTDLNLSKYYCIFERHEIDLNTFWTLTEDDLKEIGIQLFGPRKRMCVAISEWYQMNLTKGKFDNVAFHNKLLLENKQLQQRKDELESALSVEMELRKASEYNLNEGIKTLKNFSDTVQHTVAHTILLQEKLKQGHVTLKKLLQRTPGAQWSDFKSDITFPLMDEMEKLLDEIHHHTCLALQQTNFGC